MYLSDNPTAGMYVVDQGNQQTGDFDEHKVCMASTQWKKLYKYAGNTNGWKDW